jgi:hypothetical protein
VRNAGLAAVALVGVWWLPGPWWLRVLLFVVGVLLVGAVAGLREEVCGRAFASTLFSPGGRPTRLADIHTAVEHVLCATELHAGEYVYFSGGLFGRTGSALACPATCRCTWRCRRRRRCRVRSRRAGSALRDTSSGGRPPIG